MLSLVFNGLLSYLVGMKRITNKRVTCKRNNSYFLRYILISSDVRDIPLVIFSKLYVTLIFQLIAIIFGRNEEEDQ